jgi:hypothetical protein
VGIAVSLIISTAGLILALAVHPNGSHSIDVNTVGWILFVLGECGPLLDPASLVGMGPRFHATHRRRRPRRKLSRESPGMARQRRPQPVLRG